LNEKNLINVAEKSNEFFKLSRKLKFGLASNTFLSVLEKLASQIGSFMLMLASLYFMENLVLSLLFLAIFFLKDPLARFITVKLSENDAMLEPKVKNFLSGKVTIILSKTRGKVETVDEKGRRHHVSNRVINDTVTSYTLKRVENLSNSLEFFSGIVVFIISLILLIKVALVQFNNPFLFFIVLAISTILCAIVSIISSKLCARYWKKAGKVQERLSNVTRDIEEIEPISDKHIEFLSKEAIYVNSEYMDLTMKERRRKNVGFVLKSFLISVSIIAVVFSMIISNKSISSSTLTLAIALGAAFSSVLIAINSEVTQIWHIISEKREYKMKYEETFFNIMNVFFEEEKIKGKKYSKDILEIPKFNYEYSVTGFRLILDNKFTLKRGEMTLLEGKSGTGKSTLIKIISGENRLPETTWKLKSIKYFNDTSSFGSQDLLSEITLGDYQADRDSERLIEILRGVGLFEKFTVDSLKKVSAKELSNGMMQRALLARSLYNLEDTDLVCIDEPIGSLDEENARNVIKFVKEYCNRDKKRFMILSTHQYSFVSEYIDKKIKIVPMSPKLSKVML
jgi:ABC-type lipoprotein export system ATPase subunit